MSQQILSRIEALLTKEENIGPQGIQELVAELLTFFELLRMKVESTNAEDKKEALELALSLKDTLEARAFSLLQAINLDPKDLENALATQLPSFDLKDAPEDLKAVLKAKEELANYRKEIKGEEPKPKVKRSKIYKLKTKA